jgi:hypothetical protein
MKQQDLLEKIGNLSKLTTDVAFRNSFMANPRTILEKEFPELQLPADAKIFLHENTAQELHVILLPAEQTVFSDQLEDAVERILDKAIESDSFKKLLIADPKGTLSNELPDFFVPDNFRMYFHENKANEIHLLVPPLQLADEELSEAELDAVVGGSRGRGPHVGRKRGGGGPKCRSQSFRVGGR